MATNALPAGTRNTSINLITEEYDAWIKLGGVSKLKEYALIGLRATNEAAAKQIESIRSERLRMKHGVVCLVVGLFAVGCAFVNGDQLRRPRRGRRVEVEHSIEA